MEETTVDGAMNSVTSARATYPITSAGAMCGTTCGTSTCTDDAWVEHQCHKVDDLSRNVQDRDNDILLKAPCQ